MTSPYFLGIDIGTQGARVVLIDAKGNLVASAEEEFRLSSESREEQSPAQWWEACVRSLQKVTDQAKVLVDIQLIRAVSVTSTSGTVIPLDKANNPLHNAIMYSDKRSAEEGKLCRQEAVKYNKEGYTGFNSSSGLSKMVWFVNNFPAKAARINKWIHAADFIIGKLSGQWAITDYTNVLKSGYDLEKNQWPEYLYKNLPLKSEWLPEVVASGTPIGTMEASLANQFGLNGNIQVVVGITDGCASQIASGAVNLGEWNTTIGTTLVIKGVTKHIIKDAEETLYNHRHPEGYWMPGGASNIGADWVKEFKEDIDFLNKEAGRLIPTNKLAYPLSQQGERFPFVAPQAKGFKPDNLHTAELFAANMEGVAYIERYAYDMIKKLSGEELKAVYTAGGGSNSDTWLKIRSNVLNVPVYKMKHVTGAVGAAILAASKTYFSSVIEAAQALTQIEKEIRPEASLVIQYEKNYRAFIQLLQEKGYIKNEVYA